MANLIGGIGKGIGEGLKGAGEGAKAAAEGVANAHVTIKKDAREDLKYRNENAREDQKHRNENYDKNQGIRQKDPLNDQLAEHQRKLANNHSIDIVKAVRDRDARAVRRALKQGGADPNDIINWVSYDGDKYTNMAILHFAVVHQDIGLVQALLSSPEINVDALSSTGITPLLEAVLQGNLPIAKLLLQRGADINLAAGKINNTPLYEAVLKNNSPLVQFLLTKGANPNLASGLSSRPPLVAAALKGFLQLCSLLLGHGAEPDGKDSQGMHAIYTAASGGHKDIIKLLISKGADPTVVVQGKFTAASQAKARGFTELSKWLSKQTKQ